MGLGNLEQQPNPCARDRQRISFIWFGRICVSLSRRFHSLSSRFALLYSPRQAVFSYTATRYITRDIPSAFPFFFFVYNPEVGPSNLLVRVATSVLITTTASTIHSSLSLPPYPVLVYFPTSLLTHVSDS